MSRVIKFRGKDRKTGQWVYGSYVKTAIGLHYIVPQNLISNELLTFVVVPETVVQFTGVPDKDGGEVFDKDFIMMGSIICRVEWSEKYAGYRLVSGGVSTSLNIYHKADYEIIGNEHDNPELLEAAQ